MENKTVQEDEVKTVYGIDSKEVALFLELLAHKVNSDVTKKEFSIKGSDYSIDLSIDDFKIINN